MYVSPLAQGKGLCKKQVQNLVEWAKLKSYSGVYVKTWSGNVAARKIFDSLGFELIEEVVNDRVNGDATMKYFLSCGGFGVI